MLVEERVTLGDILELVYDVVSATIHKALEQLKRTSMSHDK